jgi:hypothetical protein
MLARGPVQHLGLASSSRARAAARAAPCWATPSQARAPGRAQARCQRPLPPRPEPTAPLRARRRTEHDEDTPGFGKFYCIPCAKYCQNATALADHEKSKPHKRRLKMLMTTARPHNQLDADKAAGLGAPDNGPKLRSGGGEAEMVE